MKRCFGVGISTANQDTLSLENREICYQCEDFDRCFQVMLVKSIHDLRIEVRESSVRLKNALGGAHSNFPFG